MYIDHPIAPSLDKTRVQHAHEPSEADEIDLALPKQGLRVCRKGAWIAVHDRHCRNVGRSRDAVVLGIDATAGEHER